MWSFRLFYALAVMIGISQMAQPERTMKNQNADKPKTELKVKMTVAYERKEEKHSLRISLTNEGDEFECALARLPWMHWHSMTILIADRHGNPYEPFHYIDDALVGKVRVKKNEVIQGEIDLTMRYPKLSEALSSKELSKNGMDLFWSYQLCDVSERYSNRMGGWVFLPKPQ
jgi:hypothetical protein